MTRAALLVCLFLLYGCPNDKTGIPIKVLVSVPCLTRDQLPAKPSAKTDQELAKLDDGALVINLAADRLEYRRFSNEASAVMEACVATNTQ